MFQPQFQRDHADQFSGLIRKLPNDDVVRLIAFTDQTGGNAFKALFMDDTGDVNFSGEVTLIVLSEKPTAEIIAATAPFMSVVPRPYILPFSISPP
jgi:hypothetical protein